MAQTFAVGDRVIAIDAEAAAVPALTVGTVVQVFARVPAICDVAFDGYAGLRAVVTSALDPAPPPAILLVDDDPDILRLLQIMLEHLAPAYDVLTASDGQSALAHFAARPIALLITDYMMPEMNGLQLTAAVKTASPTTLVIMITAYSSAVLEQLARDYQVDVFLAKAAMFDLKDVVQRVLGLPAQTDDE